jgi:hypothetical protein
MDFIPKVKNMDEPVNKETGEENQNFIYSDEEDFETYEDEVEAKSESFIPQAKAKTIQDDIFEEDESPPKPKKEGKKTKSGKERKPMSEEHKEKLKQAREKAFLVKKQKAEERKKLKEQDAEEKKLLKLKKQKDIEKLKKEVYEEPKPQAPPPAPVPVREIIREPTLTKEDIEKAQLNAIMSYEKLRLARKEEKKKKQSEDAEMDRLRDKLMKAKNPNNRFSMNNGFF